MGLIKGDTRSLDYSSYYHPILGRRYHTLEAQLPTILGSCPQVPIYSYTIYNPRTYYMATWASRDSLFLITNAGICAGHYGEMMVVIKPIILVASISFSSIPIEPQDIPL